MKKLTKKEYFELLLDTVRYDVYPDKMVRNDKLSLEAAIKKGYIESSPKEQALDFLTDSIRKKLNMSIPEHDRLIEIKKLVESIEEKE